MPKSIHTAMLLGMLDPKGDSIWSFYMWLNIYQSTWRNIPEDLNLQQYGCENLKSSKTLSAYKVM
jgi:hypothetical protein